MLFEVGSIVQPKAEYMEEHEKEAIRNGKSLACIVVDAWHDGVDKMEVMDIDTILDDTKVLKYRFLTCQEYYEVTSISADKMVKLMAYGILM